MSTNPSHEALNKGWPGGSRAGARWVECAASAGFCMGVERAVQAAEALLAEGLAQNRRVPFYMFGELIHNRHVVQRFLDQGVVIAHHPEEIPPHSVVLIRAHGITPEARAAMLERKLKINDLTCAYVHRIHRYVRAAYEAGEEILILGAPDHPEIQGINGECEHQATILQTMDDVEAYLKNRLHPSRPVTLVCQTTFSVKNSQKMAERLKSQIERLAFYDTICAATENRQSEAASLASRSDAMIVIGSKGSSNTMKLLDTCSNACGDTYLVETTTDLIPLIEAGAFRGKRVGITAGASSPKSIIREVIHQMSENEMIQNQMEAGDVSFTDFVDNIPELKRGITVKGVITSYDDENVYVDVRAKSEGRIPRREFDNDPDFDLEAAKDEHREIEVYVRSIRNSDMGQDILLSKSRVDYSRHKAMIEEAFNNKTPVTVKVTNVVKDGVIAAFGSVDIYIHRTQLELGVVENLEDYKGKTLEVLITQFDPDRRRIRVSGSRRTLLNQERRAKAAEIWDSLQIGDIREGVVRSLTDFGAFVDIGGVDGLVHVSELSWNRIKHPSEVVSVGDPVEVYIKEFDPERKRISLGYKRIEDDPYHNIEERFPVGSVVSGKVVRMFPFGAFVELAPGVDALCHISQISNHRLTKPQEVLTEGQEVQAKVVEVNDENRRISISIREVAPIDAPGSEAASDEEELPTQYIDREENPEA